MADAKTQLRVLLRKWAFAVVWVTLPFIAGPALADTLDPRSPMFRTVVSVALWLVWTAVHAVYVWMTRHWTCPSWSWASPI